MELKQAHEIIVHMITTKIGTTHEGIAAMGSRDNTTERVAGQRNHFHLKISVLVHFLKLNNAMNCQSKKRASHGAEESS